jgi:hypothetical protein
MADVSSNLLTSSGLICLEAPLMPTSLQHKIKTYGLSPFFVYSSSFSLPLAIFSVGTILPYQVFHDHRLYDLLYL